jgi:raffinose/stachyose/melibiose transport system permease protein
VSIVFIVPFVFILLNALMSRQEANLLNFALPSAIYWDNFVFVFEVNNFQILRAFRNSGIIVVCGVLLSVLTGSMAGYVIQRRKDKAMSILNSVLLVGLMVPPTIMPTIWVLETLNLNRSLFGLVFIQVALQLPFTTMLYRGFMSSVPEELEEAGYIDGCSRWRLFFFIVFPLLKPITATVTILNAVHFFNDFMNPLFFLPGAENITVQLTLFHFMGQFGTSFNLLFANALLITIPMLILFIFFNRRIVDGMVAGAVKG